MKFSKNQHKKGFGVNIPPIKFPKTNLTDMKHMCIMRSLMSRQMLLPHERPIASSHSAKEATVGAVIGIHVDPCFQMNARKKNNGEKILWDTVGCEASLSLAFSMNVY